MIKTNSKQERCHGFRLTWCRRPAWWHLRLVWWDRHSRLYQALGFRHLRICSPLLVWHHRWITRTATAIVYQIHRILRVSNSSSRRRSSSSSTRVIITRRVVIRKVTKNGITMIGTTRRKAGEITMIEVSFDWSYQKYSILLHLDVFLVYS